MPLVSGVGAVRLSNVEHAVLILTILENEMAVYISIKEDASGPALTVEANEAKKIIDSMTENAAYSGEPETYIFKTVEMTKKEFNELPEFLGF